MALKDRAWTRNHLLTNDTGMRDLLDVTLAAHPIELGDEHAGCLDRQAGLLFAYLARVSVNKADGSLDHYELGTQTVSLVSDGTIERHGIQPALLGDGAEKIRPKLNLQLTAEIANAGDPELQTFFALTATTTYVEEYKGWSAGGPFQAAHISPSGVLIVPY